MFVLLCYSRERLGKLTKSGDDCGKVSGSRQEGRALR